MPSSLYNQNIELNYVKVLLASSIYYLQGENGWYVN